MRSERLQLVELRLGYKTTKHLNATDLTMKVTHSVEMLGGEVSIDETVLFVFDDSMKQRARRWFSDLNNGSGGKIWKSLAVSDFNDYCLLAEDMPYTPANDYVQIKKDVQKFFSDGNNGKALAVMDYWCKEYGECLNRYNKNEAHCIKLMLQDLHRVAYDYIVLFDDEEKLDFEILLEDYPNIFS